MRTRGFEKSLKKTKIIDWCSWILLICIANQYLVNMKRLLLTICYENSDNFVFSSNMSRLWAHRNKFKDRFHANNPNLYGNKAEIKKKCISHQFEEYTRVRFAFALNY